MTENVVHALLEITLWEVVLGLITGPKTLIRYPLGLLLTTHTDGISSAKFMVLAIRKCSLNSLKTCHHLAVYKFNVDKKLC